MAMFPFQGITEGDFVVVLVLADDGDPMTEVAKAIGATICPVKFERFERGEGIEKRHDNLADEIAQMQNM